MKELIERWDGLGVVSRFDRPTGTWIFIALHDGRLGRPTGGTRMRRYETPEDGLRDAMRLAAGMTFKWAALELPMGGAKAVLALARDLEPGEREGLLGRYGGLIENLRGAFATGEDLGTTPEDMQLVAASTRYVHVHPDAEGKPTDPGPFTARGVASGIRAALSAVFGDDGLEDRTILVQGVGDVGAPLARMLAEGGARLLVSDLDEERLAAVAAIGATVVPADAVYRTDCDVYAPCAVGAILSAETIPLLRCRIVAGSANNQLAAPEDGRHLHDRGILYAPDYVINGGGALAFGLLSLGLAERAELAERTEGVGDRLRSIFQEAAARGEPPADTADRQARAVLENGLSESRQ